MSFRLLVEGSDDLHLIKNLLRANGVDLGAQAFLDCQGIGTLLNQSLSTHLLKGGYAAVGAVVDADADPGARWHAVRDRLRNIGYNPPLHPPPEGMVLMPPAPVPGSPITAVGLWLMPNNVLPGTLEDFAEQLIPAGDDLWTIAKSTVSSLTERRFAETATRKAEIHTFLAWQQEPGTPLGLAVTKRYFQTNTSLAHRFVNWVRQLRNVSI